MERDTVFLAIMFVLVFALIAVLALVLRKKQGKYDERQEIMRGKGAKYGLYTAVGIYLIFILARAFFGEALIPYTMIVFCAAVFLGIAVYAIYCIFRDSYFTDRQRPTSYLILSGAMMLSQAANCSKIFTGEVTLAKDPDSIYWNSLGCVIIFSAVFVATIIKMILSKKERE